MKKIIVLSLVFCLVLSLASITVFAEESLKLTGWSYEVDVVNENLEIFEKQYGIEVDDYYNFPSNQYHDKLVVSFVGGTEFDVVYIRDSYIAEWASAGWVTPIDDFEGVEKYKEIIPQAALDQMSFNGELYGLPYYAGRVVMAYNDRHLKEAGIESPPETWKELAEQAQIIKDKGISERPIVFQMNKSEHIMQTIEQIVFAHNGRLFDESNNPILHEDEQVKASLEWIKENMEKGLIDTASLSSTDHELVRAMSAGTRTFALLADYNVKTLNDPESSNEAGNIKMELIPGNDEVRSGTTSYIRFYAITSNSDQKEDAWKLVQFLGGEDKNGEYYVAKKWAIDFGLGFVQKPLYDDPDVRASIEEWGDPEVIAEQDEYAVSRDYRFTPWFQEWQTNAWGEFQQAISGDKDIDEVLEDLAEEAEELKSMYQ